MAPIENAGAALSTHDRRASIGPGMIRARLIGRTMAPALEADLDRFAPDASLQSSLVDAYRRQITYLRLSVTDRCDLRCVYCMSEGMQFLPKRDLLSVEELYRICRAFIRRGTRKIRLTGGEPLVRRDLGGLLHLLSRELSNGNLGELTLTTNGTLLAERAQELADSGIRRINVSVDSIQADVFRKITRGGDLNKVLRGIDKAQEIGLRIKINTVALRGINEDSISDMIRWAHGRDMDLTLIETMPMGSVEEDRTEHYLPLSIVRERLSGEFELSSLNESTGGPARYVRVGQTGGRLGFITPMTHNFCENCNRVRVTCTGVMYMCLGQHASVNLREALRACPNNDDALHEVIDAGIRLKPRGHDFIIASGTAPAVSRHMSVTGG